MLTPREFARQWQAEVIEKSRIPDSDQLVTVPPNLIAGGSVSDETRQFLTEAGLPASCAPCLTFDEVGQGLKRIWDVYSPVQWKANEKVGLEPYGITGSDGAGSPICLDERNGHVVVVDHERLFDPDARENSVMFVNSSIRQLCECLLAVSTLPAVELMGAIQQIDE